MRGNPYDIVLQRTGIRNHLLEAVDCILDFGAVGNIVLDSVDERRNRYAAGVGSPIFAVGDN